VALLDRSAVEQDVALGDLDHAVDHPHGRRLAAPRRPDQHADVAGRDLERQTVDRRALLPGISLHDIAELQRCRLWEGGRPLGLGGVLLVHEAEPPRPRAPPIL
jgi:hypothetical protein